jgi:methyl-accepting chemotaxis protein
LINKSIEEGKITTTQMDKVEKYAKNINKILRKIENVVTQTTMLAVSGNIEAARAGEFGKGFAVVSSDIRNLAIEAGNNIEKIIDTMAMLDEEISNIVRNWTLTVTEQNKENESLNNIVSEIDSIVSEIDKIAELIESLLNANEQNKEALQQAGEGAEQIILAAAQAESNSNESKTAADMISSIVERMNELVEELAVAADELQQ